MKRTTKCWALCFSKGFVRDNEGNWALFPSKRQAETYGQYREFPVKVRVTIETIDDPPTKESPDAE